MKLSLFSPSCKQEIESKTKNSPQNEIYVKLSRNYSKSSFLLMFEIIDFDKMNIHRGVVTESSAQLRH